MTKHILKWGGLSLAAGAVFVLGAAAALLWIRGQMQTFITLLDETPPEGIEVAEYVEIGGVRQWLQIRGQDRSNPVLLYVHGGPGDSSSELSWVTQRPWEDFFTVVQWDQRGAGRSGLVDVDKWEGTVTLEQITADTIEVMEHLEERLGVEKIILLGHSWGTVPAAYAAQERPDLVSLLISMGQVVDWRDNYNQRHENILAEARRRGDMATVEQVEAVFKKTPPPSDLNAYRRWMGAGRGFMCENGHCFYRSRDNKKLTGGYMKAMFISPYIPLGELLYQFGYPLTTKIAPRPTPAPSELFQSINDLDLRTDLSTSYDVPFLMIMGEHDWQTPTNLARAYFDMIDAPQKTYVLMKQSAHALINEEPGRLLYEIVYAAREANAAPQETGRTTYKRSPITSSREPGQDN